MHGPVARLAVRTFWVQFALGLACALSIGQPVGSTRAADPPAAPGALEKKPPTREQRIAERDRRDAAFREQLAAGKLADAIKSAQSMLEIEREVFGDDHGDTEGSRRLLAEAYALSGDFDSARQTAEESVAIQSKAHGDDDWRTRTARDYLKYADRLSKLDEAQRDELAKAAAEFQKALNANRQRKFREGLDHAAPAVEKFAKILGGEDYLQAERNYWLGQLQSSMQQFDDAAKSFTRAAEMYQNSVGEAHPDRAACLHALAAVMREQKKFADSAATFRQAWQLREQLLGADHADTRSSLTGAVMSTNRQAVELETKDEFAEAHALREQALELNRKLYKDDDWHIIDLRLAITRNEQLAKLEPEARKRLAEADAKQKQSGALYRQNKSQEALPLCQGVYDTRVEILGKEHIDTASAANLLGLIQGALNNYPAAEKLLAEAAGTWRAAGGSQYPEVALALQNLGGMFEDQSKLEPARQSYEEALKIRVAAYGEKDEDSRRSLQSLNGILDKIAQQQVNAGDLEAAEETRVEWLAGTARLHGKQHWQTVDAQLTLENLRQWIKLTPEQRNALDAASGQLAQAQKLIDDKKSADAQKLIEQALATRLKLLGPDSFVTNNARRTLVSALRNQDKLPDAEKISRQALATADKIYGHSHPSYALALENLGHVLYNQGEYRESVPLYQNAYVLRRDVQGTENQQTITSADFLANAAAEAASALEGQDDYAAAKPLRTLCVLARAAGVGPNHWQTSDARYYLEMNGTLAGLTPEQREKLKLATQRLTDSNKLVGEKKFNAAVEACEQALQARKEILGDKHRLVAVATFWLVAKTHARGDTEQAIKMLLPQMELLKATIGANNPDYAYTQRYLADMYREQKDLARAIPALRLALESYTAGYGNDHKDTQDTLDALLNGLKQVAAAQDAQGDLSKSKPTRKEIADLTARRFGEKSWQAVDARWSLYRTELWPSLKQNQRKQLLDSDKWMAQAQAIMEKVRPQDIGASRSREAQAAVQPASYAAQLRQQVLGDGNPMTADALELLAETQGISGDGKNAMANYQKALAIRRKTQGDSHPSIAAIRKALITVAADAAAVPFQRPSDLTPQQQQRLAERDRINVVYEQKMRDGDWAAAYRAVEAMLKIEIEVYRVANDEIASSYENLVQLAEWLRDGQLYRQNLVQLVDVRTKVFGANSWQAAESRAKLADFDLPTKLNDQQRQLLQAARDFPSKMREKITIDPYGKGDLKPAFEATELLRKALLSIVGENHLYYADCLEGEAQLYRIQGNDDEASALFRKSAEIIGRVLTKDHPLYQAKLNQMALVYYREAFQGPMEVSFEVALPKWKKYVEAQAYHYGADHWRTRNARLEMQTAERMSKVPLEDRRRINELAQKTYSNPDSGYRQIVTVEEARELVRLCEKYLGDDDRKAIDSLASAARIFGEAGDSALELAMLQRVMDARRRIQGDKHPATAKAANRLGLAYYSRGDYVQAEALLREAREILEALGFTNLPAYATYLNNLAVLYEAMGDVDRAESLLRIAINVRPPLDNEQFSEINEDNSDSDEDAGQVLLGQFNLTEALKPQFVSNPRPPEPDLAHLGYFLNNLALISQLRGDLPKAELLLRQSLDLLRKRAGTSSLEYIGGVANLAAVCMFRGDLDQAELLMERVVEVYGYNKSREGAKYAKALNNLGAICLARGELDRSETLRKQALEQRRTVLGDHHPDTLITMANLALLADRRGQSAAAVKQLDNVLDLAAANLQLASAIQSERQQLLLSAALRGYLDHRLSITVRDALPAEGAYRHVLAWKGMVSARQRRLRALGQLAQAGGNSEVSKILAELEATNRELAAATFASEGTNDAGEIKDKPDVNKLSLKRDELERALAAKSKAFDQSLKLAQLTPAQLKALLPANTALVDLVEFDRTMPGADAKAPATQVRHLAAFVVRADNDFQLMDLGPTDPIEKLVDACRKAWIDGVRSGDADPAAELRKLLWEPIASSLSDITTVLVSPDGAAGRIPLAALPGSKPGSYLIEDLTIATVPVPQLLGEALKSTGEKSPAADELALLCLGDVDFDAEPGQSKAAQHAAAPREGKLAKFGALPGTALEVQAVAKVFGATHKHPAKVLEKAAATEDAFRQQAHAAAYLHLATHGFFAPAEFKRADEPHGDPLAIETEQTQQLEGWNPGLLSGIVLAGVNRPVAGGQDDGIITAAEVADLNLSQTQLVVLSACETGLGQIAGGEGALGLQRAFQVAGARSVVSSLWKVDDTATQLLMTQFYDNLWNKKLPPLAAFREAQLSLLHGKVEGARLRGLSVAKADPQTAHTEGADGRLPPRLWAAFVVSGSPQ